jgi:hypothetical protein
MNRFMLIAIPLCLLFSSCSDDPETGTLELVFKARYGSEALVYGKEYNYYNLGTILFGTTDFFYSSLNLSNSRDNIQVTDVDYVSIMNHHTSEAKAEEGLKVSYTNIPAGDYTFIDFNIGLTGSQNKTKPAQYVSTHPLGDGTRYWAGWNSYIFTKTEGVFKNGDEHGFSYHSGFDNSMRALHFLKDIKIKNDETARIEIIIDYEKMFFVAGAVMDIPNNSNIHNASVLMDSFVDQYPVAISIK